MPVPQDPSGAPDTMAAARRSNDRGVAFLEQGKVAEAAEKFRQALHLRADFPEAYNNLGYTLARQGQWTEAIACYQEALRLRPEFVEAYGNLAAAFQDQGQFAEAETNLRAAVRLRPEFAGTHFNLGAALLKQKRSAEAMGCFERAVQLEPGFAKGHHSLGLALRDLGRLDEAQASYEKALRLKPDYPETYLDLGNLHKDQGLLDEALTAYRTALELRPDAPYHSNLVYGLSYHPGYDAETVLEECRRWDHQHAEPLSGFIQPHTNDRCPDRCLRIGYVSPDFRAHPVGRFLLPILEAHDHAQFEIFCYASQHEADALTDRCRALADTWRNIFPLSDQQAADLIRRDRIDLLVDVTMHMAGNRLLVFARKPAPVQLTYLAYCGTTGLRTMDYRLTDPYLDPPDHDDRYYAEQSIRLPQTYWCYPLLAKGPSVNALPALATGHVTFGCLNNFFKVTPVTLDAWCRLLRALPGARLVLHAHAGRHRERVRDFFAQQQIAPERLEFVPSAPLPEYLGRYGRLDVALDPFPYGGGTTTCDALWMGVPVVSKAGPTALGRGGLSILSNVGLADLVAQDDDQYIDIAVSLASDLSRLSELRASLRERLQASPLMDGPRFTRALEAVYRRLWQNWCSQPR
jgi:predicted O-linked N-acetylglucosamine transferase (SPINDLY family)